MLSRRALATAALLLAVGALFADGQTKVSIDIEDGNVRDVILALARTAAVEVVVRPEVRGLITVNIREMPFEQALGVVAATSGHRWRLVNGVYHVGRFSDTGDDARPRRETIPVRRHDARALARSLGFVDLDCLAQPAPAVDLRHLLPPGLAESPRPAADGRGLEVRGTVTAIADMRHLIASLERGGALITYECYLAFATPAAVDALPVAWARGEMQFGASPGRELRSSSGDYSVLLDRLRRGLDGITAIAQPRATAGELSSAEAEADGATLAVIGRLEESHQLRLWLRAGAPAPGGTVEFVLDGALLPPEEGIVLVSEPAGGGAGPVLLVMMPRIDLVE